jgi:HAD superfamily hydrolase (TIGR01509 family)
MDGTLTRTNRLIFDSFNYIAEKYQNKKFSEAEITAMFGPPEEGALLKVVRPDQLTEAMDDYLRFYRENHPKLAQLYPGIEEALRFLKSRGCTLAIFTGKGVHTTSITLDQFHLRGYFDYVVTGNDVEKHKPSAEGIHKIMSRFNLKPQEVLMVGDAVSDVKAARESGVQIAAVLWDSYARDRVLTMDIDFVFHNVEQFTIWLRRNFD